MAGRRRLLLLALLLAAATLAVAAAVTWLLCSCTKVQSGPDDDHPLPGFCMGMTLSLGAACGIAAALGFLHGLASAALYCHFAYGDDDEEEAAEAKKVWCLVDIRVAEAVPGVCKN